MSLPVTPATTESVAGPKIEIGFNENGALFFGVAVLLLGAVLWAATGPLTEKTDFVLTYFGAYMIHKGEGPKLYDVRDQERVRDSLFKHPNPLIYEHPPFEALLFAPHPDSAFDLMFSAALTVSLTTGLHMFTHDFSPLVLAMLLAARHFPGQGRPALRLVLATVLALLWIPPIYFALVAWHGLYLMSPILLVFAVSMLYLAQGPASGSLTGGTRAPVQ